MKKKLCLVVGKAASGKSTLAREAGNELGLRVAKSCTTRPPRNEKERNGIADHYFISRDDLDVFKNQMVAKAENNGEVYFTTLEELDQSDIFVVDPSGVRELRILYMDRYDLTVIYVSTADIIMAERARERGDDMGIFEQRLFEEQEEFRTFEKRQEWNYWIPNNGPKDMAMVLMKSFLCQTFDLPYRSRYPKPGDVVQHFKRTMLENPGDRYLYRITSFAMHTETKEKLVIYESLYEDLLHGVRKGQVFARPYAMFMDRGDKEKYPDAKQEYRLEIVDREEI